MDKQLVQAGLKAREARDLFMDTVAHFGPDSYEARSTLFAWGKAHKEAKDLATK